MEKRSFAITRGFMVHPRGREWYIVGPRDSVDRNAARKGQERSFGTEPEAWVIAWRRATQIGKRR
jgi:hypothetical protein